MKAGGDQGEHTSCGCVGVSVAQDLHKEFSFRDEELGGRHGAETLVGGDEEEGAHPVRETVTLASGSSIT